MENGHTNEYIRALSIDGVIFGFHENELKVLLLRWKNTDEWSLPGGFIRVLESVDTAAQRVVQERTGLTHLYLQQFHVFGDAERYDWSEVKRRIGFPYSEGDWWPRTVSIGYYALVDHSKVAPMPDQLTEACAWWALDALPNLLFDHNQIIDVALASLRKDLTEQPIGHLLPDAFTIPELQRLHETILGYELDARNFYKKMMSSDALERLPERRTGTPHKAPYLYRFRE